MQQLQKIDLLRDDANRKLREIAEQIGPAPFLDALDAEIEAQTDAAGKSRADLAEARAQVELAERRMEATDERIYGGTITDHRTLQDLQGDLYTQRQNLVPMKDAALAAQHAAEAAAEAESWLRQLRVKAASQWDERQADLAGRRDEAERLLAELTAQVGAQRARLAAEDLATYDDYRLRGPRVVAPVAGGVCGECRLSLPTMVITRARRADRPIECPSCGCLVRVS